MYGRGCTDMKGGLMASVMAVKLLQDAGYELPGDVTITSVCDEEGGGNGSIQAVMRGLKADGVVNCEPTDDTLILAHMGWVFFKVDFEGKACHSGAKAEGVSAIEKAIKVIQGLNEMEHRWLLTDPPPPASAAELKYRRDRGWNRRLYRAGRVQFFYLRPLCSDPDESGYGCKGIYRGR